MTSQELLTKINSEIARAGVQLDFQLNHVEGPAKAARMQQLEQWKADLATSVRIIKVLEKSAS